MINEQNNNFIGFEFSLDHAFTPDSDNFYCKSLIFHSELFIHVFVSYRYAIGMDLQATHFINNKA